MIIQIADPTEVEAAEKVRQIMKKFDEATELHNAAEAKLDAKIAESKLSRQAYFENEMRKTRLKG